MWNHGGQIKIISATQLQQRLYYTSVIHHHERSLQFCHCPTVLHYYYRMYRMYGMYKNCDVCVSELVCYCFIIPSNLLIPMKITHFAAKLWRKKEQMTAPNSEYKYTTRTRTQKDITNGTNIGDNIGKTEKQFSIR